MGSRTGSGWAMEHGDDDIVIFKDHDFVMLGDIHKPQILDLRVEFSTPVLQFNKTFQKMDVKAINLDN